MGFQSGQDPAVAIKELAAFEKAVMGSLQPATDAGADVLAPAVAARARVDTGELAGAIGPVKYRPKDPDARATRVAVGPFYRRFLEFGTSHAPAYPFIRPAYVATKGAIDRVVLDTIRKGIDKGMK